MLSRTSCRVSFETAARQLLGIRSPDSSFGSNTELNRTVVSAALQRSLWPTFLRSDAAHSRGVRFDIFFLSQLIPLMGILVAIAGIATPLGLYETLLPAKTTQTQFHYVVDNSPFGYGTPPRSNYSLSRICGTDEGFPIPCPFSDTITIITDEASGIINYSYPYSYNISIPDVILDTYSSGTNSSSTVSNYFDIQWRRYITTNSDFYNNGSTYLVGAFRYMQSLILNNATQPVEGLVVDTIRGGVGLRNHTAPQGFAYGVTWHEDLLFIEPETVCVDTNLTIDFTIKPVNNTVISNVVLTDRGGFVNLNHTYPEPNFTDPQANPDLFGRAYKAAWLNNAYTALYYNVTDPNNPATKTKSFSYLNSELNKTFPLPFDADSSSSTEGYNALSLSASFGDYLTNVFSGTANSSNFTANVNPFNIGSQNFSDISKSPGVYFEFILTAIQDILCVGAGNGDFANISNILVSCGLMHGVPQRQDSGSPLVFEAGSQWSQKLFSCATAVKATIKTVAFSYNGTDGLLSNLAVTDVQDKVYPDEASMPLWGVENTDNSFTIDDLNLVWGLVSPAYENNVNVSTVRQPSLYLPGWIDPIVSDISDGESLEVFENLPGSDFAVGALESTYCIDESGNCEGVDYSGNTNMAMWVRWQQLTASAETATLIPNLIFTDTAASAIVGTKGVLGPGNAAQQNDSSIFVTPFVQTIRYHYVFAIPALLVALLLVIITLMTLVMACFSRGKGISRLRLHLQRGAPGRIYTTFLYAGPGVLAMKSKDWSRQFGKKIVDLSGQFPNESIALQPSPREAKAVEEEQLVASSDTGRWKAFWST